MWRLRYVALRYVATSSSVLAKENRKDIFWVPDRPSKSVLRNRDVYPADPHFLPSRIPDLRSNNSKSEVVGKSFVATNVTKLKIILFLKRYRKMLSHLTTNLIIFNPKNCNKALRKMGLGFRIWDHGSAWSAPCWCPDHGPPPGPPENKLSAAQRE